MRFQYVSIPDEYANEPDNLPEPFELKLPFERGWKDAETKILVVVETVPSDDLRENALISGGHSRDLLLNTLKHATRQASAYYRKPTPSMRRAGASINPSKAKFAFINYNNRRWFKLDDGVRRPLEQRAANRVISFVKRAKPDMVLVLGDDAARRVTDLGDGVTSFRGHLTKVVGTDVPATSTLDVVSLEPGRGRGGDDIPSGMVVRPNILGQAVRHLVTGLVGAHPHSVRPVKVEPRLVTDIRSAKEMFREVVPARAVAVDSETSGLQTTGSFIHTLQFATTDKYGWVLPIHHPDNPWSEKEREWLRKCLRNWLAARVKPGDTRRYLIGQNMGYDMRMLMHWLSMRHWHLPVWDLMAAEFVLDENIKMLAQFNPSSGPHRGVLNLRKIAAYYDSDFFHAAAFSKEDRNRIGEVELLPDSPATLYCAADVQLPFAVHEEQQQRAAYMEHVDGNSYRRDYARFVLNHMSNMVNVSSVMRHRGTRVDREYILKVVAGTEVFAVMLRDKLDEFRALPDVRRANGLLRERTGVPTSGFFDGKAGSKGRKRTMLGDTAEGDFLLDMGKPDHKELLFCEVAGLKPLKKGKTGRPSFNKAFKEFHAEVDCVRVFKEYEDILQLHRSFIRPMAKIVSTRADDKHDDRVHPEFGVVNTWTGRSNSSDPSLQQIPQHSAIAAYVKRILISTLGHLHLEGDYSQFEVRCMTALSADKALTEVLKQVHDVNMAYRINPTPENLAARKMGGDLHKTNYSFFTGVPIEEVTPQQRQASKGIIFGVMYGMADKSLGVSIGRSEKEAGEVRVMFFTRYEDAKRYLDMQVEKGQAMLFTVSPLGRRRNLYAYLSSIRALRGAQDRRAQNSEIQGLASDICFDAAYLFAYLLNQCMEQLFPTRVAKPFTNGGVNARLMDYLPFGANAIVHDSIKSEATFNTLYLNMHLLEYSMTAGVMDMVRDQYGWDINVPLDVEMDIGVDWSRKRTWNGGPKELNDIVRQALEDHRDLHGSNSIRDMDRTALAMERSYRMQRGKLKLDQRFPLPHPLPV